MASSHKKMVLTPYKLQCRRPPLSAEDGPPDFHVLLPGCPEDTLEEKSLKEGYKETAVQLGITEEAESLLTHTSQGQGNHAKLLEGESIAGFRAELLGTLRDVFAKQLERQKESVQYGVALSGSQLAAPEASVPALLECSSEQAHFWLLDLAGSRPLRFMANLLPAMLARPPGILRLLMVYGVPLQRAVWCLKVLAANTHRRPGSPAGPPPGTDLTAPFTRGLLEQLEQQVLDPYSGITVSTTPLPPTSPFLDNLQASSPGGSSDPSDRLDAEPLGGLPFSGLPPAEEQAARYAYLTRLLVRCAGEWLLDMEELVPWAAKVLNNPALPLAAGRLVHTLLQACMESIAASPLHVRTLAERLTECGVQQSQPGSSSAGLLPATCQSLLHLVAANPASLLPLDCLPQLCDLLHAQAALLGPESRPLALDSVKWLKAQSAALALSVTPPRTLGLSDSVAMQRLYRALAAADAKAGGEVLKEYSGGGSRSGRFPLQEGVILVCEWAVGDTLRCPDPFLLLQLANGSPRPQGPEIKVAADLAAAQLFALQLLHDLLAAQPAEAQRQGWLLQDSVFGWLDARMGGGMEQADKAATEADTNCRNVVSLLLLLVRAGFFSPEKYLTQLLSLGILTQTAGKPPCSNESELQRAQRHRRYLHCLHPELLERPSPYSMAPTTPELAPEPLPGTLRSGKPGWSTHTQHYARGRRSALSIVPPEDSTTSCKTDAHKREQAGPATPAHTPAHPHAHTHAHIKEAIRREGENGVPLPPAKRQRVSRDAAAAPAAANRIDVLEALSHAVLATLGYPLPASAMGRLESGELTLATLDMPGLQPQVGTTGELSQAVLLSQIGGLRAWQKRHLGDYVTSLLEQRLQGLNFKGVNLHSWVDGLREDLATPSGTTPTSTWDAPFNQPRAGGQGAGTPAALNTCLPSGDMWLLRAVGLLVACGFSSAAVDLLVYLLEQYMQDRLGSALDEQAVTRREPAAAGQPPSGSGRVWAALKISVGTVMAALDGLQDRVGAMGMVPRLLDISTSWAFKYNVPPIKGRQLFGRMIQYAGGLLGAYWESPVCKDWWGKTQQAGQPAAGNSQHWLVADLEGLATQANNLAPRGPTSAPSSGPLVAPLVGLLPKPGTQRWLHKLGTALRREVEAAAANNKTSLLVINRTSSLEDVEGLGRVMDHLVHALGTWCGCVQGSQVNEDLVAAAVAGLLRNYVKLSSATAMTAANTSNPFHPSPSAISREAHVRCISELKQLLLRHQFSEAEALVPQALMAGAAVVLKELGLNASKGNSVDVQVVASCVSLLLSAVAHGLVGLVDLLSCLLAPGQLPDAVQLACRAALLGNWCCEPQGTTAPGLLSHLDLGDSCTVGWLQQRLGVDSVWHGCEDLARRAVFGLAKEGEAAAMDAILRHRPSRRALLSDPRLLYQRLCSTALTSLPLDRVQQALALPARLLALSILAGEVVPLRHCRPLLDCEYDVQQMTLLGSVSAHTMDLHWLLLRLMMDEQVLVQAIRVDRKVPKLALETAQAAFAETNKEREKDRPESSQVDKNFCEVLLISILQRSQAAVLWAELAWQLGKAIGDALLNRFNFVLQDRTRELLSGTKSVAQKLLDMAEVRKKQTDLMRSSSDQSDTPTPGQRGDWSGPVDVGMLQFSAASAEPYAVEAAVADLVLVGLTKSNLQLRTKIAAELVRQLGMVAELVKGLPVASIEQLLLLLLTQQSESCRLEEAADLPTSEGGSRDVAAIAAEAAAALTSQGSGDVAATVRRRSFGPSNARLQRRASAGGKAGGDAQAVYPQLGLVQVGIWLKLRILLPMLPMVYADKEPDPKKNMRALLASSLMQLCVSPYVHTPLHMLRSMLPPQQQPALDAAVRAAELAGEPLLERLVSILHAVVSGHWASWLRGNRVKLREVPMHEGCATLAAEVEAQQANLPPALTAKLLGCLPLRRRPAQPRLPAAAPQRPGGQEDVAAPTAGGTAGKPAAAKGVRSLDPWLPLEVNSNSHGTALGGCIPYLSAHPAAAQPASQLLAGAIRRKRGSLLYSME